MKLPFSENKAPLKPGLFDHGLPCGFTRLKPNDFPKPYKGKSYFTACYQKSLHYRSVRIDELIIHLLKKFCRFSEHFDNVGNVFRPSERSRLVYEILLRCPYRAPDPMPTGMYPTVLLPLVSKAIDNPLSLPYINF